MYTYLQCSNKASECEHDFQRREEDHGQKLVILPEAVEAVPARSRLTVKKKAADANIGGGAPLDKRPQLLVQFSHLTHCSIHRDTLFTIVAIVV